MAELELNDIQALVARGHGRLPFARFVLVEFAESGEPRAWLRSLASRVTPADVHAEQTAVHVAFTAEGLRRLGLPAGALAMASSEFREGMTETYRQRILGDIDDSAPGRWHWGGPSNAPVDAVLLLYAVDQASLDTLVGAQVTSLRRFGLIDHTYLDTAELTDREPFGFRDGISQPVVPGFGREGAATNTVRAGEFVLGYENEYGLLTDRPLVTPANDPDRLLPDAGEGLRDFGRNGTYLVIRQLEQDVHGFWNCLDRLGGGDPGERARIAAKMVGRWPGGAPLAVSPAVDDAALGGENDFGYHAIDEHGLNCPAGAHIRRANPRDSLEPDPGTVRSYELNKRHRLLRRGRPYGPPISLDAALGEPDGVERGIHFACLAGNLARQFEFVQHTWLNNPKFAGGYDEVDPIAGTRGLGGASFRMPATPVRERLTGLPSFVTVRGGAYFFMPGIRALTYLGRES